MAIKGLDLCVGPFSVYLAPSKVRSWVKDLFMGKKLMLMLVYTSEHNPGPYGHDNQKVLTDEILINLKGHVTIPRHMVILIPRLMVFKGHVTTQRYMVKF